MINPADHMGLVHATVFAMVLPRAAHLYDDLVQEGMLGLVEAAVRYDEAQGPFAAYAVPYIRGFVLRAVRDGLGLVRLPPNQWRGGARPARCLSLEQPSRPGGDESSALMHCLASSTRAPDDEVHAAELRATVQAAIDALPDHLRATVKARFEDDLTLEEAGEQDGITRQAVMQREAAALRQLRPRLLAALAGRRRAA